MAFTFRPVNQVAHDKAARIPEVIWDAHKDKIVHQYQQGGQVNGVARALKWILSQDITNFKPTRSQLDVKLKAWGAKIGSTQNHQGDTVAPSRYDMQPVGQSQARVASAQERLMTPAMDAWYERGNTMASLSCVEVLVLLSRQSKKVMVAQAGRFERALTSIGITKSEAEIQRAFSDHVEARFSVPDLKSIEEAAVLFSNIGLNTVAYSLYAVLCEGYQNLAFGAVKLCWLKLWTDVASSALELMTVELCIEYEIVVTRGLCSDPFRNFILQSLLATVRVQRGSSGSAMNLLRDALIELRSQRQKTPLEWYGIDLNSCLLIRVVPRIFEKLRLQFGLENPIPSASINMSWDTFDRELNHLGSEISLLFAQAKPEAALRSCLEWCQTTLFDIADSSLLPRDNDLPFMTESWCADSLKVFEQLWVRTRGKTNQESQQLWMKRGQELNISIIELLMGFTNTFLALSSEQNFEPILRAWGGAQKLTAMEDKYMVKELLSRMFKHHCITHDTDPDQNRQLQWAETAAMVFDVKVKLTDSRISDEEAELSQSAIFTSIGYDAPLASSNTNSSIVSLKRCALKNLDQSSKSTGSISRSWKAHLGAVEEAFDHNVSLASFPQSTPAIELEAFETGVSRRVNSHSIAGVGAAFSGELSFDIGLDS